MSEQPSDTSKGQVNLPLSINPHDLIHPTRETMKILWDACAFDISESARLIKINRLSPVIASREIGNSQRTAHASNFTKDLPLLIGALSLVPAHHEVSRMCFAALASLVPWSSDRFLMIYEQARDTGLAAMEETIFLTIAEVSIAMCKEVDAFPEALGDLVDTALEIYKWLPFTSYGGMIKWTELLEEAMVRWPYLYKYDPIRSVLHTIRNQKKFWSEEDKDGWAHRALSKYDILIAPTLPIIPRPSADASIRELMENAAGVSLNTSAFNLTGLLALSLPIGFLPSLVDGKTRLPVGMQIISKNYEEAEIYKAAHAWENDNDWHTCA
ncbi:uncharacterized protein L199_005805 [Kwoniella botswanensis]|uniref:uncharacterized protein n=1 Tax=Kwoniella botswanensis TaxID=1268659 RepID=UPI00315D43E6